MSEPRLNLTPEERAQRLLDGRKGWQTQIRDTGGGYVVCEVSRDGDDEAPYAWVSDSEDEVKPYRVGVYPPSLWEEPVASECVSEPALQRHVFAQLAEVEAKVKALLREAQRLYESSRDGQSAVEAWAEQPTVEPFVRHRACEPCELQTPHVGGLCAVCGTPNKEAGP
jgi:hypothetical protein